MTFLGIYFPLNCIASDPLHLPISFCIHAGTDFIFLCTEGDVCMGNASAAKIMGNLL